MTPKTPEERLSLYKAVTASEAEAIEPGCTGHTVVWLKSPAGKTWLCHSRLGIRWSFDG